MQGFNMGRYRPPDADPRIHPFNPRSSASTTLTVRFELPFHLICLSCSSSLPQGLRFNATKSTIGTYLSTKIYRFDCKCPRCSTRFSVETDPQRSQYVVGSGARRRIEEWDPAEYGGFPVHDTDKPSEATADAFASVERESREKEKAKQRQKRVAELEAVQEAWCDPAEVNARLRRTFRKDKRKRVAQMERDAEVKSRIGWGEQSVLLPSPGEEQQARDGKAWRKARSQSTTPRTLTKSSGGDAKRTPAHKLHATLVANTKAKRDPFLAQMRQQSASSSGNSMPHPSASPANHT